MKFRSLLAGLALLASTQLLAPARFAAQTPPGLPPKGPIALLSFADGSSLTTSAERGISDLVGLQKAEVVNLQLTFPTVSAGHRVVVQSLDGGFAKASGPSSIVSLNRSLTLTFQAGTSPGLNRILIFDQGTSSILRFWVINTERPESNPPLLR